MLMHVLGLVLIIPYGLVAEHLDRRILLVVNAISYTASMLYIVAICKRHVS